MRDDRWRCAGWTLLVCLLATVAPARADGFPAEEWSGLFALRPQLPGKLPFLVPKFGGGSIPARRESRWRADLLYTSSLQFTRGVIASERPDPDLEDVLAYMNAVHRSTGKDLYYFDGETARLDLGWTGGMPGGWELGVELPVVRHSGGWMDGHITSFHNATGLSDAGRDSAPEGAGAMVLITQDGRYVLTDGELPDSEIGDLLLSARFPLPMGPERLTADLAALVEAPTGDADGLAGSGSLDLGTAFALHWTMARWRLTLGLGYSRLGDLEAVPDLSIADTWTATGGFEFRATAGISIIGQVQHSTSPYADLRADGLSDPAGNMALGGRFALGRHWLLDVALVEDLLKHNTDLDLGLLTSVGWRPGGASPSPAPLR